MSNQRPISRRQFMGQMSCAAVGSSAILSSLLNLRMTSNVAAASLSGADDYKALVCIFLAGGNDSFNMLIPREADEYARYATVRQNLALPSGDLLPITDATGRKFGLHPDMT